MKTIQVIFSGNVQGVGFRFFTREKAIFLNLKGNVQNLANSKVKAIFQGRKQDIEKVIVELQQNFLINKIEVSEILEKELKDFRIIL
ncbi:MAG: acylphosphatase [Candidatus Pacebacteria bacterium]|nr:acylphosphatase [Candidatus Paceibacterota bacterium]